MAAEPEYLEDISHYAMSSAQDSVCSVEPGTAEDVGTILTILGSTRTPFGIKGGGHIMNPNYSSTTGVQITMSRFTSIEYDASTSSVAVGVGNVWDDVYEALMPYNVNVVGGRVSGIGVAGYTLGGGYSYLTNQYGLTIDNVLAFELVLPNGTVINVTDAAYPDLFFALKGGYNNYGIVTTFTYQTYPQGLIWGGQLIISGEYADQVNAATANFSNNVTDPKAAVITTYDYEESAFLISIILFYDAPTQPPGIFDEFLAIPTISYDVSTMDYLDLVLTEDVEISENMRGYYNTVPLMNITTPLLEALVSQLQYWQSALATDSGTIFSYDVEPFLPTILTHGGPSAYPWTRAERFLPLNIYFAWTDADDDADFYNALVATAANLTAVAVSEGQILVPTAPHYPNYALYGTSLSLIYGTALPEMEAVKETYDPQNVMGLAGGWKVPT
ncbi:FAD-binding domain-containing protein [Daedalea quercina L-15889]|uniref:FAD-binding domain-containing protein n=1 Tax=Daedalea quercina L-15889 TaxID=1314783 RepID=A0A165SGD8_9APHY|nr:FAD-binding domain-containing protein [Daedalea quercina L-15889]